MKRNIYLLTLLMSLCSLSAFSQSLSVYRNSVLIPNNDTIVFNMDTATIFHDYEDFDIKNNSSHAIQVWVRKVYLNVCPNTLNNVCWGICSEDFLIGPNEILANTLNTTDFSFHYNPNHQIGSSLIRYVFFRDGSPDDSVCFNIKFRHLNDVGINEINNNYLFSNVYPNPASNFATFNYSFSANMNHANIVVADLLGKEILSIPLSNNEGKATINTKNIANGIYIYSLQLNGRNVNTKKLIINH